MEKEYQTNEINNIIDKYTKEFDNFLKEYIKNKNFKFDEAKDSYITTTQIVPYDFFNNKLEYCYKINSNIQLVDFSKVIVLYTDIKNSTKILSNLNNNECIYIAYLYYSTSLLKEILDLFGGKLVEITGDGTYSIFEEINFEKELFKKFFYPDNLNQIYNRSKSYCCEYINIFSGQEFPWFCDYMEKNKYNNQNNIDENIRFLFFIIYRTFNFEINELLSDKFNNITFATRVGCVEGECKITKFDIKGHVLQQKLIGEVVHKASHQASGKI